jgi:AcrR family transcriptional regulator
MMAYRTTPKMEARKAAKRQLFLDTATALFGEKGYHDTTVPDVVATSGTSTGSFYSYFRNKEDLFAEVLSAVAQRLAEALNADIRNEGEPASQMRAAVEGTFRFLTEHPHEARILLVESSSLGARLEGLRRQVLASHARSVEAALGEVSRDFPEGARAVLARCWVGAVYEAARWWLEQDPERRRSATRVGRMVASFNLRGVGVPVDGK